MCICLDALSQRTQLSLCYVVIYSYFCYSGWMIKLLLMCDAILFIQLLFFLFSLVFSKENIVI